MLLSALLLVVLWALGLVATMRLMQRVGWIGGFVGVGWLWLLPVLAWAVFAVVGPPPRREVTSNGIAVYVASSALSGLIVLLFSRTVVTAP